MNTIKREIMPMKLSLDDLHVMEVKVQYEHVTERYRWLFESLRSGFEDLARLEASNEDVSANKRGLQVIIDALHRAYEVIESQAKPPS